jgi:hypothetical protein
LARSLRIEVKEKEAAASFSRVAAKRDQFDVQTFMVFMPVSASVLVLKVPLSTIVVVVTASATRRHQS